MSFSDPCPQNHQTLWIFGLVRGSPWAWDQRRGVAGRAWVRLPLQWPWVLDGQATPTLPGRIQTSSGFGRFSDGTACIWTSPKFAVDRALAPETRILEPCTRLEKLLRQDGWEARCKQSLVRFRKRAPGTLRNPRNLKLQGTQGP